MQISTHPAIRQPSLKPSTLPNGAAVRGVRWARELVAKFTLWPFAAPKFLRATPSPQREEWASIILPSHLLRYGALASAGASNTGNFALSERKARKR